MNGNPKSDLSRTEKEEEFSGGVLKAFNKMTLQQIEVNFIQKC